MISQKMLDALNGQVAAELFSSNLYLSMAAFFDAADLRGFSHWMQIQAHEELAHALKIFEHVLDRSGRAKVGAIAEPPFSWESPLTAMEAAYLHEVKVTGLINDLVALAVAEKDNATFNMLQWFVAEQVEEEKQADEIVKKLKLVGDKDVGLIVIDEELARRGSK
ncbi:MAG TPA: ferritin [Conexivisphaerales archaeon]|nr:ferritin [Conexivisphaerales archaeon]